MDLAEAHGAPGLITWGGDMTTENPWIAPHVSAERIMGGNPAVAAAEYADAPGPFPCDCGGTYWYKATIGAGKCTSCGELCDSHGDPYM